MCSVQEMQRIGRELSSELVESSINPAFLHMSVPLLNGCNPLFYLQLNGEAIWEWKSLCSLSQLFETLQDNWFRIAGYRLLSSSRNRVGTTLYSRMQYITKKLRDTKITSYRRQATLPVSPLADRAKLHDDFDLFGNARITSDCSEISAVACKHSKPIT